MKALWIESAGNVQYGDLPDPTPPAGWVKLKVLAASVCGGDQKVYKHGRPYKLDRRVSGHEFVGVIEEIANENSLWRIGQRVCVYPVPYCGTCDACKQGYINMCENRKYIGGKDFDGGFAEYAIVPESVLLEVPESVSDIEAAMTEPFAVALHAVNQAGGADLRGKSLVIYGAGPIGLFALEAAKHYGVKQIIVLNRSTGKLEIAKAHGATHVICANAPAEELWAQVFALTGGKGADAVVDAVCQDVTIDNSLHFCKRGGKVSVVGLTKTNCMVDFQHMIRNELTLVGSYTYTTEMQDCLKILGSGQISTSYIANPVVPLSEGADAFRKLAEKPAEYLKAVFIP